MQQFREKLKWVLLLLILASSNLYAQKKEVIGVVTDQQKEPLIGVTVQVKGTKDATITDASGRFSIKADPKGTLVFSYVAMESATVAINSKDVVNVTLKEKAVLLNEVVAVGYGSVKRKDLTGAVSKVNMAEMTKAPIVNLDQALAGRVAGLNIITPDASPDGVAQVTIRGGSLSQDASPLYIIDGFPMENFDMKSLDPKSIESIDVLKDASSIAIYGSRGANGVIIINTKQGTIGKTRVTYNFNYSVALKPDMPAMMSPYEYVRLQNELSSKEGLSQYRTFEKMYLKDATTQRDLEFYRTDPGYNWTDLLMSNSPTQTHGLLINGGNNDTKYNVSLGYSDQKGVIMNTGLTRYNGQISLDQRLSSAFKLQFKASHNNTKAKVNTVMNSLRQYRPTSGLGGQDLLVSELDSAMMSGGDIEYGIDPSVLVNPRQQAENEVNTKSRATTQVNGKLEFRFLKDFIFTTSIGGTFTRNLNQQFYNSKTIQGLLLQRKTSSDPNISTTTVINANGVNGIIDDQSIDNYLNENLLEYRRKFNKNHSLSILGGVNYQYSGFETQTVKAINMTPEFEYLGLYNLSSGTITTSGSGVQTGHNGSANQMLSYLGRLQYNFKDRYLFTANFRADGSSKFIKGKQWGYFPSGAFAWRVMQEPFMRSVSKVVSDAKIRVSTGVVGNNRGVPDFSYLLELGQLEKKRSYSYDPTSLNSGLTQYFYPNKDLRWEKTFEYNIGLDLSFLDDRFTLTTDFYNRNTTGFLMPKNIPYYAGYMNGSNTRYENVGDVTNRGLEVTFGTTLIKNKSVNWNVNFNTSYNINKITDIAQGNDVLIQGYTPDNIGAVWIAKKGGSISQFYGFLSDGLYQYQDFYANSNGTYILKPDVVRFSTLKNANYPPQPGDRKYKDLNGDGIIDDNDRTVLGSPIPILIGGLTTNFEWKGFSLQAFFQYSYGNKVLNYNAIKFGESGRYYNRGNMYASFANRWTPENTNTDIPKTLEATGGGDVSVSTPRITDKFVEDGSYIRFKTLALSYTMPKKALSKLTISSMIFTVSAQNIALWTNYSGQDPEVSNYGGVNSKIGTGYTEITNTTSYSSMTGGLDNAAYPRSLILTGGVSITF